MNDSSACSSNDCGTESAYDRIARVYANAIAPIFLSRYAAVLEARFISHLPGHRVLDIGCGSGNVAGWLHKKGLEVVGFDASSRLVADARSSYPGVRFIVGDFKCLPFLEEFDGALCLFDTVNHLLNERDLLTMFRGAARALKDGGVFLLDINTSLAFETRWQGSQSLRGGGEEWTAEPRYDPTRKTAEFVMRMTHPLHEVVAIQEVPYEVGRTRELLMEAGFRDVDAWDSTVFAPKDVGRVFLSCLRDSKPLAAPLRA